jgi:hypothetical protein
MVSSGRQAPTDGWRIFGAPVVSKRFSTLRGHHQELGVVEPFWDAQLAVLAAVVLVRCAPEQAHGWSSLARDVPRGGCFCSGSAISTPYRHHTHAPVRRRTSIGLIAVVTAANFAAEGVLVHYLLQGGGKGGRALVFSAAQIWFTNVAVFGLWFWEVDDGGPHMRTTPEPRAPVFLFPQMDAQESSLRGWRPAFLDYLYVALTNARAFSPADAMPLRVRIKCLMLIESIASLLTVGLVAARAVNILNTWRPAESRGERLGSPVDADTHARFSGQSTCWTGRPTWCRNASASMPSS